MNLPIMHNHYLLKIVTGPLVVLVLHILATVLGWYEMIWWLDKPLHFLGGVSIAISAYYLISYFSAIGKIQINWKPLMLLAIFSAVALCAMSWEFMEFYFDRAAGSTMQGDVLDTITDMLMGMLGGMLISIPLTFRKKSKK